MKILEASRLNGCAALPLAVRGWSELLEKGNAGDCVALQWDQSALWIEEDGAPVAVIVWQLQDYRSEVWISLSYVSPVFRNRGYFKALYGRLVELAQEKKLTRIAGGVNVANHVMRAAAESVGRRADYLVYAQSVEPKA